MNETAYRALHNESAYIDLSGRGEIRVTGEDRARLLHAMTTNQVQNLAPGMGSYAFFLSAQGKILTDAYIFAMPDYLLLDTEPDSREFVKQHLDKYIIADDVELHDFTAETAVIAVEGPRAAEALNAIGASTTHAPYTFVEWNQHFIAHVSYTGGPGYRILLPAEEKEKLIALLSVVEADLETAEVVRIENGRPRFGADITSSSIVQETRQMHAVNFSKGCYVGQEIVERVRSRGHVNKHLVSLTLDSKVVPVRGAKVTSDGADVGEITSAAYSPKFGSVVAIGIVRTEAAERALSVDGASARVRLAA
jgi:folate-binding protein YgfZ